MKVLVKPGPERETERERDRDLVADALETRVFRKDFCTTKHLIQKTHTL